MSEHVPTSETRQWVFEQIAYNASTHGQIYEHLGISKPTFYKYYGEIAKKAKPALICKAANVLYRQLDSEDPKIAQNAAMFILKTRGQWRETDTAKIEEMDSSLIELKEKVAKLQIDNRRDY